MKKYISIILSILMLSTILTGCGDNSSENTKTPVVENQLEILETDNDAIKTAKQVYNEIQRYMLGDILMTNMSRVTSISTEDYSQVEDYTDAVIIRDNNRELYNESNMDYLCIHTEDGNYIFTQNNEVVDVDAELSNFTTGTYNNYLKILDWIFNYSDKFEYSKNIGDDNTISYVLSATDVDFVKERYYSTFGEMEILEFIDSHYEFVFTFNVDNQLVQIDWFGTDTEDKVAIETATTFSTDLQGGYDILGENTSAIWDLLPQ